MPGFFTKKNIIIVIVCVVSAVALFLGGFLLGRYARVLAEDDAGKQVIELERRTNELELELKRRIDECEILERQLGEIGSGISKCMGTAQSIRGELENLREGFGSSNKILKELGRRLAEYEARIEQLEKDLDELKRGADKQ